MDCEDCLGYNDLGELLKLTPLVKVKCKNCGFEDEVGKKCRFCPSCEYELSVVRNNNESD